MEGSEHRDVAVSGNWWPLVATWRAVCVDEGGGWEAVKGPLGESRREITVVCTRFQEEEMSRGSQVLDILVCKPYPKPLEPDVIQNAKFCRF